MDKVKKPREKPNQKTNGEKPKLEAEPANRTRDEEIRVVAHQQQATFTTFDYTRSHPPPISM